MIDISTKNKRRLLKLALDGNKQAKAELQEIIRLERPWKLIYTEEGKHYLDEFGEKKLIPDFEYQQLCKKCNIMEYSISKKVTNDRE